MLPTFSMITSSNPHSSSHSLNQVHSLLGFKPKPKPAEATVQSVLRPNTAIVESDKIEKVAHHVKSVSGGLSFRSN